MTYHNSLGGQLLSNKHPLPLHWAEVKFMGYIYKLLYSVLLCSIMVYIAECIYVYSLLLTAFFPLAIFSMHAQGFLCFGSASF